MRELAQAIGQIVERERFGSVSVGALTAPPSAGTPSGTGLRKLLIEELSRLGVTVKNVGGALGVEGTVSERDSQMTFKIKLTDASGEELTRLNARLRATQTSPFVEQVLDVDNGKFQVAGFHEDGEVAEFLGRPLTLGTQFIRELGHEVLIPVSQSETREYIDSGAIARVAGKASPFGLEIVIGRQARPLRMDDGLAFVDLQKDDEFQLYFRNDAPFAVAVTFHLDGVNSFAFSDMRGRSGPGAGQPLYSKWIVDPRSNVLLKGWHRTNETVDRFLVTDFSESAAARLGRTSNLGLITATVRATWKQGERAPADEMGPAMPKSSAPIGIGRGRADEQRVVADRNARTFGIVRAVIPIRYVRD